MQVGFRRIKWFRTTSAWQDMQHRRERRAAAIKAHLDMMESVNTAFSSAQQNNISGMAANAAQAALKRIQVDAKAKSAEILKHIDGAQGVLDSAKSGSSATPKLDTVA